MALLALRGARAGAAVFAAQADGAVVARARADGWILAYPASSPVRGVALATRAARRLVGDDHGARAVVHVAVAGRSRVGETVRLVGAALDAPTWWVQAPARGGFITGAAGGVDGRAGAPLTALTSLTSLTTLEAFEPEHAAPPLVGRDAELGALVEAVGAGLAARAPTLCMVVGPTGSGKTRLGAEAVARRPAGVELLAVKAPSPERSLAVPLIRQIFGADVGAEVALEPRPTRARQLAGVLLARARRAPLCVLVDDAQWADPLSLDVLELATLDETDAALTVVVCARGEIARVRPLFGERAARAVRVPLGPLAAADARRLLGHLLADVEAMPEAAARRLVELGEGLPQQLVELIGALELTGAIGARPGGSGRYLAADELLAVSPTPLSRRLADRALAGLPAPLAELARFCAVFGPRQRLAELRAGAERLAELVAADPDGHAAAGAGIDTDVGVERLISLGLLVRVDEDTTAWAMPMLAAAIEERLPPAQLARAHRALLETLRPVGATEAWRARMARHAAGCGDRARAVAEHRALAEAAAAEHRHVVAEQHYSAALALLGEAERSALDEADSDAASTLRAGRARARVALGRGDDARADLDRACRASAARGDRHRRADLLLDRAGLEDWADRWADAAAFAAEAAPLIEADGDERLRARLALAQGRAAFRAGRLRDAEPLLVTAARLGERSGEQETREAADLMRSSILVTVDRVEEAEALLDGVIARCRGSGDLVHLCAAYNNRLWLWFKRGAPDQAVADQRTALGLSRELGHVQLERYCTFNLAELCYWRGELDEAERLAKRARQLQERHVGPVALDPILVARIAAARGHHDMVEAELAYVQRLCPELPGLLGLQRRMLALVIAPVFQAAAWSALLDEFVLAHQLFEHHEALAFALAAATRDGDAGAAETFAVRCGPLEAGPDGPAWARRFAAARSAPVARPVLHDRRFGGNP
jgi:tetratricopeptide (TPR) repeat protein